MRWHINVTLNMWLVDVLRGNTEGVTLSPSTLQAWPSWITLTNQLIKREECEEAEVGRRIWRAAEAAACNKPSAASPPRLAASCFSDPVWAARGDCVRVGPVRGTDHYVWFAVLQKRVHKINWDKGIQNGWREGTNQCTQRDGGKCPGKSDPVSRLSSRELALPKPQTRGPPPLSWGCV